MLNPKNMQPGFPKDTGEQADWWDDWDNAFKASYSGDYSSTVPQGALDADTPGARVPSFAKEDVAFTLACVEGCNDENDWLWVGTLKDGRWAALSAWCDYTGWG